MLLEKYGGIYADMDMYCLRSLDFLLREHPDKIIVGETSMTFLPFMKINNGLIACSMNHPFWVGFRRKLLLALHTNTLWDDIFLVYNVLRTTGPGLWSSFHGQEHVIALPYKYFYSLKVNKKRALNDEDEKILVRDGSYVYHMQDSSWMDPFSNTMMHFFIGQNWVWTLVFILCLLGWWYSTK